jgi:glycosyltransferase involved in cell wall biosynthesis
VTPVITSKKITSLGYQLPGLTEPLVVHAKTPMVTVVIPAYNRAATVGRAIESVLNQTHQDFEIVVVDDGSTDTTASVVAAITDPRITLIRHERNLGGGAARNTGYRAGSAPFVAFLDSDDEWLPTKLERQLEVFERANARLGLVYTGTDRIFPDGTAKRYMPPRHEDLARVLLTENVIGETSVGMVRRSALDVITGFDESLPAAQDMDLWLRLCERFHAKLVPEALVRVAKANQGRITVNPGSTTAGRDQFRRKHQEKLMRYGVLHLYLRESAWRQQRFVQNNRAARRLYWESIRANPFVLLTYLMFATAFLPVSWLDRMARFKHFFARVAKSG